MGTISERSEIRVSQLDSQSFYINMGQVRLTPDVRQRQSTLEISSKFIKEKLALYPKIIARDLLNEQVRLEDMQQPDAQA